MTIRVRAKVLLFLAMLPLAGCGSISESAGVGPLDSDDIGGVVRGPRGPEGACG